MAENNSIIPSLTRVYFDLDVPDIFLMVFGPLIYFKQNLTNVFKVDFVPDQRFSQAESSL